MSKQSGDPSSLTEAIEKLENAGRGKVQDFKEILEKDYNELRKTLDDLKPYLDDLRSNVETEVKKTKNQVENKVKENPWIVIGIVGLVAFVIGWIFSQNKKGE
ncbi:MAG: hypothetical protein V4654_07475 [Bdellovibrionota bacterium]